MLLVYRYRIKSLNGLLNTQSRAVNLVWNYCNDTQKHALQWRKKWPTGFNLNALTVGSSKELGLHSGTINAICEQYAKSRGQLKRPYLRYRTNKSLGWIPIKGRELKREGNSFRFAGKTFRIFHSRALPDGKIRDGSNFSRDARGNWFLNIVIEISEAPQRKLSNGVGIDLGLKEFAALSTGEVISSQHDYKKLEPSLVIAQRANKKRLVAKIHAKIANRRADELHKISSRITQEFDYIAVGNVKPSGLAKTKMAKSVLDASWSTFRNQLAYKAIKHGAWYEEVNESFTSQICSNCGALPNSRPKGIADLGIRQWVCSECGVSHDRDINAALNILARHGHVSPAVGISLI
ncbi:RNA-guided endonuclease InsQ/TnpB family protein [Polynucleobacter asymbioticus]|uniref:Transposase n=1 Tax=Polynucleobacter asymbioticus TaxID=576611 RepID=A0AAC9NGW7_9BURK|nr:RNA-guided endonuclease TnpB family protein [Polynucleobacter asymbioticus]APB98055.1 transposase [Polynucleobacter asymbioticus]APC00341.1 transposase [Polynucleobacter asymbioticus]